MKRLVEHGGPGRVGEVVAGHVGDEDASGVLELLKDARGLLLSRGERAPDAGIQIEARLEVHIGDEVAARHAVQGKRDAVNVDARDARDGAGRRRQALGQVLGAPAQFLVEMRVTLFHD